MSAQYIYYVYAYIRKDGTPYYIGKGKGNRAFATHKRFNSTDLLPKDRSRIIFVEKNLSEVGALAIERRLIRWYGRKIDGSGILRNICEGGEGNSMPGELNPRFGVIVSDDVKKKISDSLRGSKHSNESKKKMSAKRKGENNVMFGKKHSDETKRKISEANRNPSEETRLKLSKARKGYKFSEETKKKFKARNVIYASCLYCRHQCDLANFLSFHGEKCKHNPSHTEYICECGYSTPFDKILLRHKSKCFTGSVIQAAPESLSGTCL